MTFLFQIKDLLSKLPANHLSKPLLKARLSDKQWLFVENINNELAKEYELRRDVLLKRLDVTIQSFKWSDKAKVKSAILLWYCTENYVFKMFSFAKDYIWWK